MVRRSGESCDHSSRVGRCPTTHRGGSPACLCRQSKRLIQSCIFLEFSRGPSNASMVRSLTFRLCAASTAVVFAVAGGLRGVDSHALATHGPHAEAIISLETHPAPAQSATDRDAHSSHSQPGSPDECHCVGPCQGGGSTTLPDATSNEIAVGETDLVPAVAVVALMVLQYPASYLFPLPNAPPTRV